MLFGSASSGFFRSIWDTHTVLRIHRPSWVPQCLFPGVLSRQTEESQPDSPGSEGYGSFGKKTRLLDFWFLFQRERERERENAKSNLETPAAHNHPHYPLFLVKHYKDIGHHFGCNRGLIEPQIYRPSVSWVRAGRKTNTHEYVLLKLCMHTDDGVAFGWEQPSSDLRDL